MEDKERLVAVEERAKSNTKRLDKLETEIGEIKELTIAVKEIAMETKATREDVNKIDNRLHIVEEKPAKKWEDLTKIIITGIATAVLGYFLAKIGM